MVARLQSDVDLSEEAELRRLVGEAGPCETACYAQQVFPQDRPVWGGSTIFSDLETSTRRLPPTQWSAFTRSSRTLFVNRRFYVRLPFVYESAAPGAGRLLSFTTLGGDRHRTAPAAAGTRGRRMVVSHGKCTAGAMHGHGKCTWCDAPGGRARA